MKVRDRVRCLCVAVGLASCVASADLPPAMDHVPADVPVVVGISSLRHVSDSLKSLATTFGGDEADLGGFAMAEALMGLEGVNADGAASVAMWLPEGGMAPEPRVVMIAPVTDFAALVRAMGGTPEEGLNRVEMDGNEVFMKDVGGGYAAVGALADLVDAYDGSGGKLASHAERLGDAGRSAAEGLDLFVVADVAALKPMLDQARQQMGEQMNMMGAMSGQSMEVQTAMIGSVFDALQEDGRTLVAGLNFEDAGVSMDFAAQFNEGSDSAAIFSHEGKTGALLAALPRLPYIFAFAADTSGEGVREVMKGLATMDGGGGGTGVDMSSMLAGSDGVSMVMGTPPGGIMGGLFASTVQYFASKEPAKTMAGFADLYGKVNGLTQNGMKMTSTYEPGAAEAAGVKLDAWSVSMEVDPNDPNAMQASQALQGMTMIFGGNAGPSGYLAPASGGVYATMVRNTDLMAAALKAGGGAETLGADKGVSSVGERLPAGRSLEGYISLKGIFDMVGPMMAMMGAPALPELPEDLEPIGMGATMRGGGAHGRVFLSAGVLGAISQTVATMQTGGEEMEMEEEGEEPGSRPRF